MNSSQSQPVKAALCVGSMEISWCQEVKKELPDETERFLEIDEDVKALLRRGFEARFAKQFCCEPST